MSDFEGGLAPAVPTLAAAGRMVAADFDGDGDADILYQTVGNGSVFQYARSNGDGTFAILALSASPFAGLTLPDNGGGTHYAGDFDGDGDTDIVAAVATATGSYFRNDGTIFTAQSSSTFPTPATATRWVTGDFDGDGDEDILYQTAGNGSAFQYARSNGDGSFTIVALASSPFAGVSLVDHNGSNYLSGDFDGDGDVDLLGTPNGMTGEFYRNDGAGTFVEASTATFPQPAAGGRMTAGDFDADGDWDILYQTGANGTAYQYARSNGDGTFTILSLASSPFAGLTLPDHIGSNFFAADFDGDGDTDLLTSVGTNGTGSYFYQVGKPPEIVSSTPADNATGVAVGANITITFDEAVSKGSGNIFIVRSDDVIIETISVNSAQVTGSGTTWTIDPSVTLSGLSGYSIRFDAGTFRDADNAEFAGIDDAVSLNFTTASDNTPPTLSANAGLTLDEGASGTITTARLDFNDAQQADFAITYTVTSLATNGTLRLDGTGLALNGTFTQADINMSRVSYLHDGSETTSASFGFSVSDGVGGTVIGQSFAFTITPVEDAPTHGLPATILATEDMPGGLNGGIAIDPPPAWIGDVDSASVTTTLTATEGSLTAIGWGSAVVAGSGTSQITITGSADDVNRTVYFMTSYVPAPNAYGNRTLTVATSDGTSSVSSTITVSIAGTKDTPEGSDVTHSATEDTPYILSPGDFGFSDPDGHALAAVVVTTLPLNGRLIDIGGWPISEDITGDGIPDVVLGAPPRDLLAGDTISLALLAGGYIQYVPAANANGVAADSFTYQVVDDGGTPPAATIDPTPNTMIFDVIAVNDAPVNTVGGTVNTTEDAVNVELAGMAVSDVEATGQVSYSLTVSNGVLNILTDVPGGIASGNIQEISGTGNGTGTISIIATIAQINATLAAAGGLTYTPDPDFNGTDTLEVYVNDGGQGGLDPNPVSMLDPFVDPDVGPLTEEDYDTRAIIIAAADEAAVAVDDTATTTENAAVNGSVFGNDSDPDGPPLSVAAVNGETAHVGTQIMLASGALLTVNADGTYDYDPNGAFDYLIDAVTAAQSGALNTSALDSFTYTLTDGGTATVTVAVNGLASAGDELWGSTSNNPVTGTAGIDYFDLSQGGNDTVSGLGGNDAFYFGDAFTGADTVDGGDGSNDQIGLEGDYTGANALVLAPTTIANVEAIAMLPAFDYSLTTHDDNVPDGGTLNVFAGNLGPDDNFTFDGSAETDGSFRVFGGRGADIITTGAGDDGIYFGPGKFDPTVDRVNGGGGTNDQLALDGDYIGLTLDGTAIQNIDAVILLGGVQANLAHYELSLDDTLVGAGQTMTIWGAGVETSIDVDGAMESDGHLRMYGGLTGDILAGGLGDDWFWGGLGDDLLNGGAGSDTFYYETAGQSSAAAYDSLWGFDDDNDKIDFETFTVTSFAAAQSGTLDTASLGATLEAAFAGLTVNQAGVFTATGGGLSGMSFLVVDANGTAGYQASDDFLIAFSAPSSPIDNLAMFI